MKSETKFAIGVRVSGIETGSSLILTSKVHVWGDWDDENITLTSVFCNFYCLFC